MGLRGTGRGKGRGGRGRGRGRAPVAEIADGPEDEIVDEAAAASDASSGEGTDLEELLASEDSEGTDVAASSDDEDKEDEDFAAGIDWDSEGPVAKGDAASEASSSSLPAESSNSSDNSDPISSDSMDVEEPIPEAPAVSAWVPVDGTDRMGKLTLTAIGTRLELYATCPNKAHGSCILTRTLKSGPRRGQGRPVGFLCAWLRAACRGDCALKADHMKYKPPFAERSEARHCLYALPGCEELLEKERVAREGEGSEPEEFA